MHIGSAHVSNNSTGVNDHLSFRKQCQSQDWNKLLTLSFIHDSQHFQYCDEFADATPSSPPCFTAEAVLNFSLADFH